MSIKLTLNMCLQIIFNFRELLGTRAQDLNTVGIRNPTLQNPESFKIQTF